MEKTKVLLVDDQILFVESLKVVLTTRANDIEVIGIVQNGEEALKFIEKNPPDVVLLDVRMPVMNGVECTQIICENYLDIKVLVLTTFDDDEYIVEALKHGAKGYLKKDIPPEELISAIRVAQKGGIMISPKVAAKLIDLVNEHNEPATEEIDLLEKLSEREKDVLRLLAKGYKNKKIAQELYVSEQTVKNYVSNIYAKLDIYDRVKVALYAVKVNLINKSDL